MDVPSARPAARTMYCTALAIVPPSSNIECWNKLQDTRRALKDKGFHRWPPHINLLYPFVDSEKFEEISELLSAVLARMAPFDIHLDKFGTFGGRRSGVCYLHPETDPADRLSDLYERIYAAVSPLFPVCPEPSKFTPHLTVTHTRSARDAQQVAEDSAATWSPVSFHVEEIYIMIRSPPEDKYCIVHRIPLGSLRAGSEAS